MAHLRTRRYRPDSDRSAGKPILSGPDGLTVMESKRQGPMTRSRTAVDNQFEFGLSNNSTSADERPSRRSAGQRATHCKRPRPRDPARISRPGALAARRPAAGSGLITGPSRLNGRIAQLGRPIGATRARFESSGRPDWVPAWTEMTEQLTLRSARSPSGCIRSPTQTESDAMAQLRLYRRAIRSWPSLMRANAVYQQPGQR